jgi:alpha-beta hydrolase superfamily lysophospholipase
VRALWLNSPFLDWRDESRGKLRAAEWLAWFFPFMKDPNGLPAAYGRSLHKNWNGEWDYDLTLKPLKGFGIYCGWVRAIFAAHAKVHEGLRLQIPVLSMHSDEADIVLDWKQIASWSRNLGPNVSVLAFPGGLHDLVLSRREIRDAAFSQLFAWAERAAA